MKSRVYLDWNASAPLRPEARAAMVSALDATGNPSSVHAEGRRARGIVERARGQVAELVGCKPSEVVFTSGATEAAGVLAHLKGGVSVDETAHDCLWAHHDGGMARAMGLANSETGVVTVPGGPVTLLDVTQAVGRIPWSFAWSGADLAVLSGHKIGGPRGVGALVVKEGFDVGALQAGGGQELGRRSGTENVPGIAGFGAAAVAALEELNQGAWSRVSELRKILENAIAAVAKETIFVGIDETRLPNTSLMVTPGWKGETQVMTLDLAGFAVSSGSACSSGKVKAPRVLRAMGLDDRAADSALRVSMGPATTEDDVRAFTTAWLAAHEKFRARAA